MNPDFQMKLCLSAVLCVQYKNKEVSEGQSVAFLFHITVNLHKVGKNRSNSLSFIASIKSRFSLKFVKTLEYQICCLKQSFSIPPRHTLAKCTEP